MKDLTFPWITMPSLFRRRPFHLVSDLGLPLRSLLPTTLSLGIDMDVRKLELFILVSAKTSICISVFLSNLKMYTKIDVTEFISLIFLCPNPELNS